MAASHGHDDHGSHDEIIGPTVLAVSKVSPKVRTIADRVLQIRDGRLVA